MTENSVWRKTLPILETQSNTRGGGCLSIVDFRSLLGRVPRVFGRGHGAIVVTWHQRFVTEGQGQRKANNDTCVSLFNT